MVLNYTLLIYYLKTNLFFYLIVEFYLYLNLILAKIYIFALIELSFVEIFDCE